MAAICGVSPYKGAINVWRLKKGLEFPDEEDNERREIGDLLEPYIRNRYQRRFELLVDVPGSLRHREQPWAIATPDGICFEALAIAHRPDLIMKAELPCRGLEIKTHTGWMDHLYGEQGTDDVPPWEIIQCAWNIYVARSVYGVPLERWDLCVWMDNVTHDYTIHRDEELEGQLVEVGRDFWFNHVVANVEPEPDGSKFYTEYLASRFPNPRPEAIEATPDIEENIAELREVRAEKKELEKREAELEQRIKGFIGGADAVTSSLGEITWRRSKDSQKVDWKEVAQLYRGQLLNAVSQFPDADDHVKTTEGWCNHIVSLSTTKKPGSRRFCVPRTWSK